LASQRFPYRKEPSTPSSAYPERASIPRPRIEVRLMNGDRFVKLLALVDSGADDCLFPLEVAHFLKLPLKRDVVHRYGGIGSGSIMATFGTVKLEVGKRTIPLYAGFSERLLDFVRVRSAAKPRTIEYYEDRFQSLLAFEPLAAARLNHIDEA
jgi:hypothetical protein